MPSQLFKFNQGDALHTNTQHYLKDEVKKQQQNNSPHPPPKCQEF